MDSVILRGQCLYIIRSKYSLHVGYLFSTARWTNINKMHVKKDLYSRSRSIVYLQGIYKQLSWIIQYSYPMNYEIYKKQIIKTVQKNKQEKINKYKQINKIREKKMCMK